MAVDCSAGISSTLLGEGLLDFFTKLVIRTGWC